MNQEMQWPQTRFKPSVLNERPIADAATQHASSTLNASSKASLHPSTFHRNDAADAKSAATLPPGTVAESLLLPVVPNTIYKQHPAEDCFSIPQGPPITSMQPSSKASPNLAVSTDVGEHSYSRGAHNGSAESTEGSFTYSRASSNVAIAGEPANGSILAHPRYSVLPDSEDKGDMSDSQMSWLQRYETSSTLPGGSSDSSTLLESFASLAPVDSIRLFEPLPAVQIPVIQNIIASVHLQREIDLREVAISTRHAEYNPRKVSAVVLRIRKPRCTGLIFRTGRLMITGVKSEADAKRGGKLMAKLVQLAIKKPVTFANFKIENIIATADCGVPVRLEGLANEHKEFCNYEPELFAGLVYRYNPNEYIKAVLLIFVSGKVVITGCKSLDKACAVFDSMYPVVVQFKK